MYPINKQDILPEFQREFSVKSKNEKIFSSAKTFKSKVFNSQMYRVASFRFSYGIRGRNLISIERKLKWTSVEKFRKKGSFEIVFKEEQMEIK